MRDPLHLPLLGSSGFRPKESNLGLLTFGSAPDGALPSLNRLSAIQAFGFSWETGSMM
ncbi:MAG: hypothetical protein ACRC10_00085 [Thermoguttaceae bacterium]